MVSDRASFFDAASYVPPDSIFEVTKNFLADTHPKKVNVGAGAYRDENGKPWVLPCVRMAEERLKDSGHEYLPIAGLGSLRDKAVELVFHGTKPFTGGKIASCQSLSGTGALHLAGLTLKQSNPSLKTVYITEPTWSNHDLLFATLGFAVKYLPYYKDGTFDYDSYMAALNDAEPGSIIVLHSCAHNPTGCDPSRDQWKDIISVIQEKKIFPIFDSAYLGFNSGSVDEDAWVIRYVVDELGLEASICLSFAKSMGLYGERVGLVTFVTKSQSLARTVDSILSNMQRAAISSPPVYGTRIASMVLNTPDIADQWAKDLITMSSRIRLMRQKLYDELVRLQTPGDWSHIVKQTGMFGYTGLGPQHVIHLRDEYHIHMADTGRISMAGLNLGSLEYFAESIDKTVRLLN